MKYSSIKNALDKTIVSIGSPDEYYFKLGFEGYQQLLTELEANQDFEAVSKLKAENKYRDFEIVVVVHTPADMVKNTKDHHRRGYAGRKRGRKRRKR